MKVLVVGNGGREQAIAWKLLQSPRVEQVFCIPGNGGTASLPNCRNIYLQINDFEGIARVAAVQGVGLVVVGPEAPLAAGIVDYLDYRNIPVFGPTRAGANIESSKSWAKALMQKAGIPTAHAVEFTELAPAIEYLNHQPMPIVVKADGLAAGKGVVVSQNLAEATAALESLFQSGFHKVLVEQYIPGQELSVLALTDGEAVRLLLPACDHKRIGEDDTGENTGGMGVYTPVPWVTDDLMNRIERDIFRPALVSLQSMGITYRGVLYAGLMITGTGDPMVLEFNCRFGDPETQAILPLLETPLIDLLLACTEGRLAAQGPIAWQPGACVCVVAAAQGYPGAYRRGDVITGVAEAESLGVQVFQAGTTLQRQQLVTEGGRVLSVSAVGNDLATAIERAYAALEKIHFDGIYYRKDIGKRAIVPNY